MLGPREDEESAPPVLHRAWYTWGYDGPREEIDEATYNKLVLDPKSGKVKVPAWRYVLERLGPDEWRFDTWFGAPLRMWVGRSAGDRVMGHGLKYRAHRSKRGRWRLEYWDVIAM